MEIIPKTLAENAGLERLWLRMPVWTRSILWCPCAAPMRRA